MAKGVSTNMNTISTLHNNQVCNYSRKNQINNNVNFQGLPKINTKTLVDGCNDIRTAKNDSFLSKAKKFIKNQINKMLSKNTDDKAQIESSNIKAELVPTSDNVKNTKVDSSIVDKVKADEVNKAEKAVTNNVESQNIDDFQEYIHSIRLLEEGERLPLVIEEEELLKVAQELAEAEAKNKLPRSIEELKAMAKNDSTLEVIEHKENNVIFRQKNPETGRAEVDYVFDKNIRPIASREYIYDEQGNVAREIMRDKENNISSIYDYNYDELKRPVQEMYSDPDGLPQTIEEYKYIGNSKEPASINSAEFGYAFDENNVLIRKQTTEYENGVMTRLLDERTDGITELSFDADGNVVKQVLADVEGNVYEVREAVAEMPKTVETTEAAIVDNEKAAKPVRKSSLNRVAPKAPNAKKLAVINDVNSIIEKRLGSKTLSEQKHDYAVGATKMRLSLLPEIFESIKDTRKAERAAGKTKMSVANKDAVELYGKINGRNKRLVNYMLKKRNADGTRTFGIRDIINTIDSTEKQIREQKAVNKGFRAADAKDLYNNLLNTQIEKYGKLQRTRKKQ